MNSNKLMALKADIQYYFRFLLDKGFKIESIKELAIADWQVIIDSSEMSVMIYCDQGDINLLCFPLDDYDIRNRIDIRTMIYYLSNGALFIGKYKSYLFNNRKKRLENLANLLAEYLDQITPYFGKDFEKYKHELIMARQKCGNIFIEKYIRKSKEPNA